MKFRRYLTRVNLKLLVKNAPHFLAIAIAVFNVLLAAHAYTLPSHTVDVINGILAALGLSSLKLLM